jgi:serine/threonine-protein kinase
MGIKRSSESPAPDVQPNQTPVTEAEVALALEQVLASEPFAGVERPSRFLRHVVERAVRGQTPDLKESLLGIEVFGRDTSWNPRTDPIVRQEAARLRKRLARYYEHNSPAVRIELPVGTYVPVFHRTPAPVETPNAPANDPLQPQPQPARGTRGLKLWLVCGALILLAATAAVLWQLRHSGAQAQPAIVVLPFTNLGEPSKQYFADGLTDEITGFLARNRSLRVLARTSAFAFKGKSIDAREVGRQLGVTHVLEGSVEWSGQQVRVSAHLERASDGAHIWSSTYDREVKDLLSLQTELAESVATAMRAYSGGAAPSHVPNPEAYELYLRAKYDLQNQVLNAYQRAEASLRQAVSIDPDFAAAWYQLGVLRFGVSGVGLRMRMPEEIEEAKSLCRKALALDPNLLEAHAELGYIAMVSEWDWAGAANELDLASRNGPQPSAEASRALWFAYHGRFAEADRHIAAARELDPIGSTTMLYLGGIRHWEGRYQDALAVWRQMLDHNPNQLNPQMMQNLDYIETGQAALALANTQPVASQHPFWGIIEVQALAKLGRHEEGRKLLLDIETRYAQSPNLFRQWLGLAWESLGDHERSLKWLEQSANLHEFQILNVAVNPQFAGLRNNPEFRALVRRVGL